MTSLTNLVSANTLFAASLVTGMMALSGYAQAAQTFNDYDCESAYMEETYDCAENAVSTEKSRLNSVYMNIYRTLNNSQKSQMDAQQIAWLKQRDNKCPDIDDDTPMNNMKVYSIIAQNLCVANETQQRTQYYLNEFDPNNIQTLSNANMLFRKVKTTSGGDINYYQGSATVSGTFDVTHPQDDITPCALCFKVSAADANKIPREDGDERLAWFGFENTDYDYMNDMIELNGLTLDATQCYQPFNATITIENYISDSRETETVDRTTLTRFVSLDDPQVVACEYY